MCGFINLGSFGIKTKKVFQGFLRKERSSFQNIELYGIELLSYLTNEASLFSHVLDKSYLDGLYCPVQKRNIYMFQHTVLTNSGVDAGQLLVCNAALLKNVFFIFY